MNLDLKKIMVPGGWVGSCHAGRRIRCQIGPAPGCEVLLLNTHRPFPVTLGEPYYQKAITKILDKANLLLDPYRTLFEAYGVSFTDRVLEGAPG